MSQTIVIPLDPSDPRHARDMLALLDEYAAGPTGRGYGLHPQARERLPAMLAARPHYWGCLALVDGEPAGFANCFETVSTFLAMPLLNVHDIAVSPRFQRRGVGMALLVAIEAAARERGCCKLTLEVLEGNHGARRVYERAGFAAYALDPRMGRAAFMEKKLA